MAQILTVLYFCCLLPCGSLQEEEPFNPDYVEVDRILDVSHSVDKDNGEVRDETLSRNHFYSW